MHSLVTFQTHPQYNLYYHIISVFFCFNNYYVITTAYSINFFHVLQCTVLTFEKVDSNWLQC